MEERVNALQSRLQAAQPSPSDSARAEHSRPISSAEMQRERKESKRRHIAAHELTLKTHAAQPVDDSWAPKRLKRFERISSASASSQWPRWLAWTAGTNSCVATLEWASFHDAKRGFSAVLHALYQVNCVKTITLPDPPDFSKPYTGSAVFLNCQKSSGQK